MNPDAWTCQMRCVAKRDVVGLVNGQPDPAGDNDCLYTFANLDGDGSLTQVIEDRQFAEIGDRVRVRLTVIDQEKEES